MKKLVLFACVYLLVTGLNSFAQEYKSKRVSPPAKVTETTTLGTTITIDYSQPSVKGRTIGKEIAPYGQVWRTGANEATVFEVNKDVKIEDKVLPAGKYSLYTIPGEKEWTIMFNKTWDQWGTDYKEADDALWITVKPEKSPSFTERMTFNIAKSGLVSLMWGDHQVNFNVK
ncbi:MAG: DUF2911 domain-containing protein [Daejeonella sp.]